MMTGVLRMATNPLPALIAIKRAAFRKIEAGRRSLQREGERGGLQRGCPEWVQSLWQCQCAAAAAQLLMIYLRKFTRERRRKAEDVEWARFRGKQTLAQTPANRRWMEMEPAWNWSMGAERGYDPETYGYGCGKGHAVPSWWIKLPDHEMLWHVRSANSAKLFA